MVKLRALGVALALVLLGAGPCGAGDPAAAARQAVEAGDFRQARQVYESLSKSRPDNLEYLIWIARLSAWLKDYPAAEKEYDEVLGMDPSNFDALVGKAYVLMWKGSFHEAGALLNRAASVSRRNEELELAWARYYHYQGIDEEAQQHVGAALAINPHSAEAQTLGSGLEVPRRFEFRFGYEHDWFNFFTPGNVGTMSIGYLGRDTHLFLNEESWDRFGKTEERAGITLSQHLFDRTWLDLGFLYGPGGPAVIPRQDYSVGIDQGLPWGIAAGLNYHYMHWSIADVHTVSPYVEYYFTKPIWLRAALYQAWVDFPRQDRGFSLQSFLMQYNEKLGERLTVHAGYAYGAQAFSAVTVDTLGTFTSNILLAGVDLELVRDCTAGVNYGYELRSNSQRLNWIGFSVTIRR